MYHAEVAARTSFVIVDAAGHVARDRAFREATADVVCCVDPYVLLAPGALAAVLAYFDEHPDSRELIQGAPGLVAGRREAWPDGPALTHPGVAWVKPPAASPFSFFDGIFCLNLDDATDRLREAAQRHARLGIASLVERFAGVPTPDNPHRGIAIAFRRMIVEAKRRGWEHVLVLEDDAVFLDDAVSVMRPVAAELPHHEWDLCYLGACVWSQVFGALGDSAVLQACGPVTCTHAVAFHRRAYDRLLADIPTGAPELERFLDRHAAIDQYLSARIADGTYRAVITTPRVASQPNLLDFDDGDGALAARYVI